LHRGACREGLQARWERRPGLQVPEVLIEANANIVVKTESMQVSAIRRPPAASGLPLLLLVKEEAIYRRAALFYLRVAVWRIVLWSRRPSWRISLLMERRGVSCVRLGAASRVVA
jgi:hypothetical protein